LSAWIVGNNLVAAIVKLSERHDQYMGEDLATGQALGQMLMDENDKSINYRYAGDANANTYVDELVGRLPTPVEGLKILACYSYQSCEHPAWESSGSYEFIQRLRSVLIRALPGYDNAPWGWDTPVTEEVKI
jgi:hypothetical protein